MGLFQFIKDAGAKWFTVDRIRTQRNGQFHSVGGFLQDDDSFWRRYWGVDDWAIYKGDQGALAKTSSPAVLESRLWLDKKEREDEDYTDVWQLSQVVDAAASATQQRWIANNVNVPELINYMAINSLIRHTDSGHHNWFISRDTEGTGRWEMWHWDLNWIFTTPQSDGKGTFLTPDTSNRFTRAMLAYPEFRDMFYRRLRTLADQFLVPPRYENQWDGIAAPYLTDWELENQRWGGYTPSSARSSFIAGLTDRRNVIANNKFHSCRAKPGRQARHRPGKLACFSFERVLKTASQPTGTGAPDGARRRPFARGTCKRSDLCVRSTTCGGVPPPTEGQAALPRPKPTGGATRSNRTTTSTPTKT